MPRLYRIRKRKRYLIRAGVANGVDALELERMEDELRDAGGGDLNDAVCRILRECAAEDCLEEIWRTAGAGSGQGRHSDDTTMLLIGRLAGGGNEVQGC